MSDAQINRDRDLRLQYLAGTELNLYRSDQIYSEILRFRTFPDGLFQASEEKKQALRQAMGIRE
jgi:hypothetical protein